MGGDPARVVAPFNYLSVRGGIDCMHDACDSAVSPILIPPNSSIARIRRIAGEPGLCPGLLALPIKDTAVFLTRVRSSAAAHSRTVSRCVWARPPRRIRCRSPSPRRPSRRPVLCVGANTLSGATTSAGGSRSVRLGAARDVNVRMRASTRRELGSDGVHGANGACRFREETEHEGGILGTVHASRWVAQADFGDCVAMGSYNVRSLGRAETATALWGGQHSRAPSSMSVAGADADASMPPREVGMLRGRAAARRRRCAHYCVIKRPKAVTSSSSSWTATTPSWSPPTLAYPKWKHL
ncbi:hypothetical protein DFH06DRAFT_1349445 [Mycena polygramma]|nr:hypothetical protein DFH06DRAFT_1349445 [Mycena polygramma]